MSRPAARWPRGDRRKRPASHDTGTGTYFPGRVLAFEAAVSTCLRNVVSRAACRGRSRARPVVLVVGGPQPLGCQPLGDAPNLVPRKTRGVPWIYSSKVSQKLNTSHTWWRQFLAAPCRGNTTERNLSHLLNTTQRKCRLGIQATETRRPTGAFGGFFSCKVSTVRCVGHTPTHFISRLVSIGPSEFVFRSHKTFCGNRLKLCDI